MTKSHQYLKKYCLTYNNANLSHKELKTVAEIRGIKGYERLSKDKQLKVLVESEYLSDNNK